jgi:uncharacterized protein involved in type VI secretion and phage assembly
METLERAVAHLARSVEGRFYGKYRGFVVDNADPEQLGRLKLQVPSVLGKQVVTGWALPCLPYGGEANQGSLFIPEKKAGVWVEFEEGDIEFPIWVGTFWSKPAGKSELPKPNAADGKEQGQVQDPPTCKIIKTKKGHTIQLEDADNKELITIIEAKHRHVITLDKNGIKVTDGANGHEITLNKDGVVLESKKDMTIKGQNVKIEAQQALEAKGTNIELKASSSLKANGTMVDLNATGTLKAKGSLIHLNP